MSNPNPDMSGLKPFKKGCVGNPGGKTKAQRKAEIRAAEISAKLRLQILEEMAERAGVETATAMFEENGSDMLRLFKDSEDRAHGTPKATTEHSGPEGSAIPTEVRHVVIDPPKREE